MRRRCIWLLAAVALSYVALLYVGSGFSRIAGFGPIILHAQAPAKQAVVDTSAGTFIIDLRSETAPNHVAYF